MTAAPEPRPDPSLRDELLAMARRDAEVRAELLRRGELFDGYHPRMRRVHEENGARLAEILDDPGWPSPELVGEDGADAAWLVVQHAIGMPDLQRRAHDALAEAVADGRAEPIQLAYLEDRIRALEGRPQRYGTQFDWDAEGRLAPLPIDDAHRVDERRRSLGLDPLAAATREMRSRAEREGERPPSDPAARRREREAWLREVGWRREADRSSSS